MDQRELENQARELVKKYFSEKDYDQLLEMEYSWNGRFRGKTAGVCRFKKSEKGEFYPIRIEISSKYIEIFPEMLTPILLHEMIHAILPFSEKHGAAFRKQAQMINKELLKNGEELISVRIPQEKSMEKEYRYFYECVSCGQKYGRVRNPINVRKSVCGKCRGKIKEIKSKK